MYENCKGKKLLLIGVEENESLIRAAHEMGVYVVLIDKNAYVTCYTSSGMLNDDTKAVASEMISKSNRLILGRHGESYDNRYFITKFNNLDSIILSSNNYSLPKEMVNYYKNTTIITPSERMNLKR